MRHAEFSSAPLAATVPTAATRPTAALGGSAGASFGRTFAEVQQEVASFIRDGGGFGLSVEGGALRAQAMAGGPAVDQAALLALTGEAEVDGAAGMGPRQQAFLDSIAPYAREAAGKLGVAPELVSAHAALESSWGQRPIPGTGGKSSSHNLFGIKAGGNWNGAVSETTTTEYVQGQPISTRERFRAYPDAAGAFQDYARMLLDNPRYRGALGVGNDAQAFAQGLARGGYATDPAYAAKLARLASQLAGTKG